MDEALRSAAQMRRAEQGPPFSVPPATLNRLKQEVARKYPEPEKTPERSWADVLWSRLGLLAAVAGVAVLGVVLFQTIQTQDRQLAFIPPSPPASETAVTAPVKPVAGVPPAPESKTASPAPAPQIDRLSTPLASTLTKTDQNRLAPPAAKSPQDQAAPVSTVPALTTAALSEHKEEVASASATVASAPSGKEKTYQIDPALAARYGSLKRKDTASSPAENSTTTRAKLQEAEKPAFTAAQPQPAPAQKETATLALADNALAKSRDEKESLSLMQKAESSPANQLTDNLSTGNTYYFSQAVNRRRLRPNFNSPAVPNVLEEFEVQRTGNAIRILDADGSVYEGSVQPVAVMLTSRDASTASGQVKLQVGKAETPSRSEVLATNSDSEGVLLVEASGTNRTLQQKVVFTGNLLLDANTNKSTLSTTAVPMSRYGAATEQRALRDQAGQPQKGVPAQLNRNLSSAAGKKAQLENGSMTGTATIGARDQIRIEAQQVPTAPAGNRQN
jgi:hypothetical protein